MARIQVGGYRKTSQRRWAIVDDEDYEFLTSFRWALCSKAYAATTWPGGPSFLMHRLLMGLPMGDKRQVDHINRDGLDNRKANLRLVTNRQNHENLPSHGRSRFRGIYWNKPQRRWIAAVQSGGVKIHCGCFEDEFEAALAAEAGRNKYMTHHQPDLALEAEKARRWAISSPTALMTKSAVGKVAPNA